MKSAWLNRLLGVYFLTILFAWAPNIISYAVGNPEIDPGYLDIALSFSRNANAQYNDFMSYDCVPEERLVATMNTGEQLHFGFNFRIGGIGAFTDQTQDCWVRIREVGTDIIVFPATEIIAGNAGYINTRAESDVGPNTLAGGGYNPMIFTAPNDGDFYIEVGYTTGTDGNIDQFDATGFSHYIAQFYDFTVTDAAATAEIKGRVWSKAWHILVQTGWGNGGLIALQYIYTDDGIISELDYNGLDPYQYVLVSNATGVYDTGDMFTDRQSIASFTGDEIIPQYPLFFDIPDTLEFPIADLDSMFGKLNAPIDVSGCPGDYCINIDVNRDANANLLIELNGIAGYQDGTEDVLLELSLLQGENCVPWDGLDGFGAPIVSASLVIDISFIAGVTHLPVFDVEYNTNGLLVDFIYPASFAGTTEIYWDDTKLGGTVNTIAGCTASCHTWTESTYGDEKIINSWWYIQKDPLQSAIDISSYSFDLGPPETICVGDSVEITGPTDGHIRAYNWAPSSAFSNTTDTTLVNNWASPLLTDVVSLVITDTFGCDYSDSLTVNVNPQPLGAIDPIDSVCIGESAQLQASGGVSYQWVNNTTGLSSTNISNPTSSHSDSITYTVIITDANTCRDTVQALMVVNPQPVALIDPAGPVCLNESAQLNASGGDTYLWINNTSTLSAIDTSGPMATPLVTTIYTVIVTDTNGCSDTTTESVAVTPSPAAIIDPITPICAGETAQINASGGDTYQWINDTLGLSSTSINNPTSSHNDTITYTVVVTNAQGCRDTTSSELSINPKPVAVIDIIDPICIGETRQLQASGGVSYLWINDVSTLTATNIDNPVTNTTTPRTYTVVVTNVEGCKDTTSRPIVVNANPIVTVSDSTTICSEETASLTAGGAVSYAWSPGTGLDATTGATVNSTLGASTQLYTVIGTDANGCKDTNDVWLVIFNEGVPSVAITYDQDICEGQNVNFSITSSSNLGSNPIYSWGLVDQITGDTNQVGTQSTYSSNTLADGDEVVLTVTSNEVCLTIGAETVSSNMTGPDVYLYPNPQTSGDIRFCVGDNDVVSIIDTEGLVTSFDWFTLPIDTVFSSGPNSHTFGGSLTGDFYVSATNWNCTSYSDTFSVSVISPFVNATINYDVVSYGEGVELDAVTNTINYAWTNTSETGVISNSLSFVHVPEESSSYIIEGEIEGCYAYDTVDVRVIHPYEAPYFFSPNGDGIDDEWIVVNLEDYETYVVIIYNRWGNVMRKYVNEMESWDGTNENGNDVPDGVYYYVIQTAVRDEPRELSGYVTITR